MKKHSANELISLLREKGLVLATAESCTGGMIGEILTSVPGASEVYCGGVISYTNHVKEHVLGVRNETLEKYNAVSVNTAIEMARGAKQLTGADVAVSVTGFAGPGGGTDTIPVGTVCFGLAIDDIEIYREQYYKGLSRDEIRQLAAEFAIESVCDLVSSYEASEETK